MSLKDIEPKWGRIWFLYLSEELQTRLEELKARREKLNAELEELKWKSEEYADYYGSYYTCESDEDTRYS